MGAVQPYAQECALTLNRFLAAILTFLAFTMGMVYPVTINGSGNAVLRIAVTGKKQTLTSEYEIMRGDLCKLLYERTEEKCGSMPQWTIASV